MLKKRALLIGINYTNASIQQSLEGCIDDVINARNMLIDAYDYEKQNIIILRDDIDDPDKMPTYENIMNELNDLASNSHEYSEIWIQYSGHGSLLEDSTKTIDVIVPVDFQTSKYVTDTDIHNFIKQIRNSCVAIFVFDCCHSGSLGKLPWSTIVNENKEFVTIENRTYDKEFMPNPNIYFLSGCKDSQTSADTYSRELAENVGAFSNTFNECLRDSRHNIDILTLYKNISACLAKDGYSQTPVLSTTSSKPSHVFQRSQSK